VTLVRSEKVLSLFIQHDYHSSSSPSIVPYQYIGIPMSPCVGHNNIRGNKSHCLLAELRAFTSARGREEEENDDHIEISFPASGARNIRIRLRVLCEETFLTNKNDNILDK